MAQWQYRIERIGFKPATDPGAQLEKILQECGHQGWELVQILNGHEESSNSICRLIFKTEKPFTAV